METLQQIVDGVALLVAIIGAVVILYGVSLALGRALKVEARAWKGVAVGHHRRALRHQLGHYILLGLEFLVAADILHTLLRPRLEELASLAVIVSIRTIVSVSLHWELSRSTVVLEEGDEP
jgi:uncharacterized membrane protein